MAQEELESMFRDAERDSTLADSLRTASNLPELVALAGSYGYKFDIYEADHFLRNLKSEELDEASLESVAGGTAHKGTAKKGETYLKFELKEVFITG